MKWKKQGHELDHIAQKLCDKATKYYLWGTANIARNLVKLCGEEIQIIGAVDSDPARQGKKFNGRNIESPAILKPEDGYLVIVASSAFKEIKPQLLEKRFEENINFFDYFVFLQIYQLYQHDQLYSRRLDIALTERCTLKCRKCNMFMPYFKEPSDLDRTEVLQQIDQYFDLVAYLEGFNLLGGEPFLYEALPDIVAYVGDKYRDRIEHFKVFTNGMILPAEETLTSFQKHSVEVQISDYTSVVPYHNRLKELISLLEETGVDYYLLKSSTWGDFGFPENSNTITDSELIPFFDGCRAPFRGLYHNRIYFCHLEASAIRAGLYKEHANDYFDLLQITDNKKKKFLEFDLGYSEEGAVSFCRLCRGCDSVNPLTVIAAEQIAEKKDV